MAIAAPFPVHEMSVLALRDAVSDAVAASDRDRLQQVVRDVEATTHDITTTGDHAAVSSWISRLARVQEHQRPANGEPMALAEYALGAFETLLAGLERRRTEIEVAEDAKEQAEAASGKRGEVLRYVREHPEARAGDIAQALGLSPSQTSRATRELMQRGALRIAPRPGDDARARRFVADAD